MFTTLGHIANIVFPILVLIIGGVCALVLGNQKTLRDSRDDLEKRVAFLEDKSQRDDQTITQKDATITQKDKEIEVWRKTVTGEVQLAAITDLLATHHSESVQKWDALGATLTHTDRTLDNMAATMQALVAILTDRGKGMP